MSTADTAAFFFPPTSEQMERLTTAVEALHLEIHQIRKMAYEFRPELEKYVIWLTSSRK